MKKKPEFDKTACIFYAKGNCSIVVDVKKFIPEIGDKLATKKCLPILPSCREGVEISNLMIKLRK